MLRDATGWANRHHLDEGLSRGSDVVAGLIGGLAFGGGVGSAIGGGSSLLVGAVIGMAIGAVAGARRSRHGTQ
jgi:outer membrane lipoprotein SlyB